jgi:glycosyltransferase involved in cell wall biosynthesis
MNSIVLQGQLRGGGTERQAIELTRALLDRGHHAELWVGRKGGNLDSVAEAQVPGSVTYLTPAPAGTLLHLQAAIQLRGKLAILGKPYVLILMGRWAHLIATFLPKDPAARWVSTVRTSRELPWLYRRTILRSDQLITNSNWALKTTIGALRPKLPRNHQVIHNALTRDTLLTCTRHCDGHEPNGQKILINVARLEEGKGHEDLIQMLRCIQDPAVQLWLLGMGPCLEPLKKLCCKLDLKDRVHFHGFREDIEDFYPKALIFVSASTLDSLPNALIEAHAAALPIVAYDAVGIPEIVLHDATGYLCSDHSPAALAEQCSRLLNDPEKARKFGSSGRERVRKLFDRKRQNEKFCEALEQIEIGSHTKFSA